MRFETEVAQLILYRRSLDAKLMLFLVKYPVSWNIEIGIVITVKVRRDYVHIYATALRDT